ncbi:MAG TPA: transferrin receptor-like dimerization domain-containing protein [Gemmatimonadaceae bacterium]|nr:transferrin receptor-like dimerization domain-containing protein [Gemmatimonadaceae bacterium]
MRRIGLLAASSVAAIAFHPIATPPSTETLPGFSAQSARIELDWESKFDSIPAPDTIRQTMRRLSARPHHVGSPYDHDNAEWILARYKSFGWDAHIEQFDVLFPTPRQRLVELVAPTHFVAKLQEPAVPGDPTSSQRAEQLPSYNAYSIDGDVTGPLVYVNYGVPADYEELERRGISVKGAIVIARYGGSWRGIKPKVAAEHGAVGCLIYSDPRDDGYAQGDVFPRGPFRPRDGVQRGSVADMPLYSGDPLTPGVGAVPGAKRLTLAEAKTITKIPVLPISYGDAEPLLAAMTGPVAPPEWRGALGVTYHLGPGAARVHLVVKSDWSTKPIYDVIAMLEGSAYPDQWVIRGNHHDGWVNGASDPLSGQSALLEEARGLGELVRQGWHPRRTIVYAAWDGEEPGLLGSTEWAETHAEELRAKAVAYINSDGNDRGFLNVGGSHTLQRFVNDVERDVQDPETHLSVWKRAQLQRIARARTPNERQDLRRDNAELPIGALGSGSDYTPFLQHLGIASLNIGYGGEVSSAGVYHSIYDDFYWYTHFGDTSFVYGRALAQTGGTMVMRLADADVLPYDFTDLAHTVRGYVDELQKLLDMERDSTVERNREIAEGVFTATSDPWSPTKAPAVEPVPPHLDFSPLDNAVDSLTRSADRYGKAAAAAHAHGSPNDAELARVNALLLQSERRFIDANGLPRRPWYAHELYAPGFYTGYGVKTIPAVREAIEQRDFAEATQQIAVVAGALNREAALVDSAAVALGAR